MSDTTENARLEANIDAARAQRAAAAAEFWRNRANVAARGEGAENVESQALQQRRSYGASR